MTCCLGSSDLVAIRVFAQSDYNPVVRVGTDGNVLLPLIGIVHLAGLSITQAEELIQGKLIDAGIYRDPQVTLQITEGPNAVATVVGETHGIVQIVGTRHLLDVLTLSWRPARNCQPCGDNPSPRRGPAHRR